MTPGAVIAVVGTLLMGGCWYYFNQSEQRGLRSLGELFDERSTEIQRGPVQRGPKVAGHFGGRLAQIYTSGIRKPPELMVALSCTSPLRFGAAQMPRLGDLGRATLLFRLEYAKLPVGDPELDAAYGFTSPDPEAFKAWLLRPDSQTAIKSVLGTNKDFDVCRIESAAGWVVWSGPLNVFRIKVETIRPVLERLDAFARTLEGAS